MNNAPPISRRRLAALVAVTGALALLALCIAIASGTVANAASPAADTASCTVDYTVASSWSTGFQVQIAITNEDTALSSWTLQYSYAGSATLSSGWDASWSQSGAVVTAASESYNGDLASGASTSIGANFASSGTAGTPSGFTLDGAPCAGNVGGSAGPSAPASGTASASASAGPSASASASATPSGAPTSTAPGTGKTVQVSTASQLYQALNAVVPGETIELAAGTYKGEFSPALSGTASAPITLTGPSTAVISGSSVDSAYGVHLEASYWTLSGFSVTTAQKGVVVDGGDYDTINGLHVSDIGDEGIHLRAFSSHDLIEHCTVTDTGQYQAGFGEGVYIGSAQSNWGTYSGGQPDTSNDDVVEDNTLGPGITAENIDVKEGTTGGAIEGNSFNATGEAGANSAVAWVDVKGNGYQVTGNTGIDAYQQGIKVEQLYTGFGCANVFAGNDFALGSAPGYGFDIVDQSDCAADPNIVYASNTVTGGAGESTIPVTPGG